MIPHFTEHAYVCVLHAEFLASRCSNCGVELAKKRLTRKCKHCTVVYCRRECEETDHRNGHQLECGLLPELLERLASHKMERLSFCRLYIRTVFLLSEGRLANADFVNSRTFWDLMSHANKLRNDFDNPFVTNARTCQTLIDTVCVGSNTELPGPFDFHEVWGRIAINTMDLDYGLALCLNLSLADHSCQPNAYVSSRGFDIYILPINESAFPDNFSLSTDVRISYVPVFESLQFRQQHLLDVYQFECDCARCGDVLYNTQLEAVRCLECDGSVELNSEQQPSCSKCGASRSDYFSIMTKLSLLRSPVDSPLTSFADLPALLHENHGALLLFYEMQMHDAYLQGDWGRTQTAVRELLRLTSFFYGAQYLEIFRLRKLLAVCLHHSGDEVSAAELDVACRSRYSQLFLLNIQARDPDDSTDGFMAVPVSKKCAFNRLLELNA